MDKKTELVIFKAQDGNIKLLSSYYQLHINYIIKLLYGLHVSICNLLFL